jgi:hypothetical protein
MPSPKLLKDVIGMLSPLSTGMNSTLGRSYIRRFSESGKGFRDGILTGGSRLGNADLIKSAD